MHFSLKGVFFAENTVSTAEINKSLRKISFCVGLKFNAFMILAEYIENNLPPAKQQEIRQKLKWSNYRWTWYVNRPEKWPTAKAYAFAMAIDVSLAHAYKEFGLAAEELRDASVLEVNVPS